MRRQLGIRVSGFDAPRPVKTFQQCGFHGALLGAVRKAGFTAPTPIQAQALPAVLSGRDVLVRQAVDSLHPWNDSLATKHVLPKACCNLGRAFLAHSCAAGSIAL